MNWVDGAWTLVKKFENEDIVKASRIFSQCRKTDEPVFISGSKMKIWNEIKSIRSVTHKNMLQMQAICNCSETETMPML